MFYIPITSVAYCHDYSNNIDNMKRQFAHITANTLFTNALKNVLLIVKHYIPLLIYYSNRYLYIIGKNTNS